MTATMESEGQNLSPLPQGLRWVFLIHAIISAIFGLAFFFVPELWGEWVNWRTIDPTVTRVFGGGLLALAYASWLGYQASSWEAVRILVKFEIAFPALGFLAAIYEVLAANAPEFSWVIVASTAIFTVAFAYYYRELS